MLVLKYSSLDKEKQLVKVMSNEKYGIFNIVAREVVVVPTFDCLQYHPHHNAIWAKQDGFYFRIDTQGDRIGNEQIAESDWAFVDKNDRCPSCAGGGCNRCYGFGIIPIGGDFTPYFMID
ncbi:hypothetical protein [Pontibacter chinhatensis]|uniref:WG containing repeat-containing protein n=1 Tax=Pontibacter chinhatensis TaxID=1436961 RepID=A0A1I2ZRP2_9BACT|nr:hypothetical protein [Pontibacter chinhatensis]SFH40478.1 hypothetical protein SAMN05421739_1188 [Pontibacter chinhatensis]